MPTAFLIAAAAVAVAEPAAPIIVTGQPLPAAPGTAPFPAITLDADALLMASRRPDDALRRIGGVQLFRRAATQTANPTAEGLTARGLSGNATSRMVLTLDGIPQADPFFGSVAWTALAARPLAYARVVRGTADPAFGLGAVAGSVAMESALAPTRLSARAGSRGSIDAALLADIPVASGALSLAARHQRGDGHLLVADAVAGQADRPARYRQTGGNIRATAPLGANSEIQAVLAIFNDQRLRGADGADVRTTGGDIGLRLVHRDAWEMEAAAWARLRDFATRTVSLSADRTTASLVLDQQATPASGAGARLELRPPATGPVRWRFGGDLGHASGETRERFRYIANAPTRERRAGGSRSNAGAFLEAGFAGAPITASLAGRIDGWWLGDGLTREIDLATGLTTIDGPAPDRSGVEWGGRAGIGWQPTPAITLSLDASRAVRLPTLNELHRPFRVGLVFTNANPALLPERSTSIQAGFRYAPLSSARFSVTAFRTHLGNAIANVTLGEGPGVFPGVGFLPAGGVYRQRQNLPAILSRGVEADAALALDRWSLDASLAIIDARVRGGDLAPGLSGRRPSQAPRFAGSAAIAHDVGRARLRAVVRHVSSQFEDDRNQRPLAPATTIDAMVDIPLGRGLTLQASAENLLDAFVETGFSGAEFERGQPQTIWIGLQWGLP